MTNAELKSTAYHEAGHAVAASFLRLPFQYVTIVPNKKTGEIGHFKFSASTAAKIDYPHPDAAKRRIEAERLIIVALAGPEAEAAFDGRPNQKWAGGDILFLQRCVMMCCHENREANAFQKWLALHTHNVVRSEPWQLSIKAVAKELLKKKRISSRDVRRIINAAINGKNH